MTYLDASKCVKGIFTHLRETAVNGWAQKFGLLAQAEEGFCGSSEYKM